MILSSSLHPKVDLLEPLYAGHHRLNAIACVTKSATEVVPRTNSSLYLFAHASCARYQAKRGGLVCYFLRKACFRGGWSESSVCS